MLQVGDTFEGYAVVGELGHGSSATVFLAEHTEIGQRVAIKLMHAPSERVTREGQVLARLSSPHTVRLLAFGRTPQDEQYLVFEYVDGEPLTEYLVRSAPVYWEQVIEIVRQILVSLAEAHAQNITHRDVKPGNVMIDGNLDVKVLDFGVAKMHNAPSITATNKVPGTPRYMAPEVLQSGTITPAADVFATGLVAYELLTGHHPNPHRELEDLLSVQLAPEPFSLPTTVELPRKARAWFDGMTAKDAASRFVDANAALRAMPEIDETTHKRPALDEPMPPRKNLDQTLAAEVAPVPAVELKPAVKPEPVGKEKNRPPSKFVWPTLELPTVGEDASWGMTAMIAAILLLGTLIMFGLYQGGAFDSPRSTSERPNPLVPDEPVLTGDLGVVPSKHMSPSIKGIGHFDRGEYVLALKEFHKIEQGDNAIEQEAIQRGNYAQRALDAITAEATKAAENATTLEEIEAAAHDPHVAQSLYRTDEGINAVVEKLRKMGRDAEARIKKERRQKAKDKR